MRRIGNIWYGLSLRKKLIVYFSVLIVIALGIVFYSFRTTYFYIERFQTTLEEHFRLNAFLKELQSHGTLLDDMSRYKTENASGNGSIIEYGYRTGRDAFGADKENGRRYERSAFRNTGIGKLFGIIQASHIRYCTRNG